MFSTTNRLEEFRDVDLVVETFSPSRLENEVTREGLRRCRFERSQLDRLVQRVTCERERERTRGSESGLAERQGLAYLSRVRGKRTRADRPMVKGLHAEGLSLRMCYKSANEGEKRVSE